MSVLHLAFASEERFAIRHQKLQVPYLRQINRRVVNFVQDPLGHGEPNAAQRRVSGTNSIFIAACPAAVRSQDRRWQVCRSRKLAYRFLLKISPRVRSLIERFSTTGRKAGEQCHAAVDE